MRGGLHPPTSKQKETEQPLERASLLGQFENDVVWDVFFELRTRPQAYRMMRFRMLNTLYILE